jgi:cytochrome c oxidase subunit 1/cytochrome c oxidase subunit I+III
MPLNWQVTDTYYIVAHFHYVLNGAVVFPIFGAIYFWYPKMSGRRLSERWGHISFWLMFIGFNVAFFGMHILGFLGMPRRISTYPSGLGWDNLNLISTIGGFVFAVGTGITLVNWFHARWWGPPAGDNPWDADSLEWATTSPPPEFNFASIPVVASRHPLWDQRPLPTARSNGDEATKSLGPEGAEHHETPETTGLDARPQGTLDLPHPTYLPFILACGIGVFFVGLMIKAVLVGVIGVALAVIGLTWWLWRTEVDLA